MRSSNGTRRAGHGKGAGSDSVYGRPMTQGSGPRRSSGSMRLGSTSEVTGRTTGSRGLRLKPVIEVITLSSSSESEGEDLEILAANLKRLSSCKTGRKYVETNKEHVHSNRCRHHEKQDVMCVRPRLTFTTL